VTDHGATSAVTKTMLSFSPPSSQSTEPPRSVMHVCSEPWEYRDLESVDSVAMIVSLAEESERNSDAPDDGVG